LVCDWAYIRAKVTAYILMLITASGHEIVYLIDFSTVSNIKWITFIFLNITQILLILCFALNLIIVVPLIACRSLRSTFVYVYSVVGLIELLILLSFITSIGTTQVAGAHAHARGSGFS